MRNKGLYERHERFLPVVGGSGPIDLGQGATPLVRSVSIGPKAGLPELYFKLENLNPTGSYKDRFAGIAIGMARAAGVDRCIATSSGNTGAALAAFCAAADMECSLYVSENAPAGKLEQMLAYGANVYRVKDFTIDAAESARITEALSAGAASRGIQIFITAYARSPVPMAGIKTIAYELANDLDGIDDVFVPVGGGGLYVAIAKGFADLHGEAALAQMPRLHAVQPEGNDTVVTPLRAGAAAARPVSTSTTISGLGVGFVLDGDDVIATARETGGSGYIVDETEVLSLQRRLAQEEGILVEPAGAVSVLGALEALRRGELQPGSRTVCILTGHGFKDPVSVRNMGSVPGVRAITRADIEASFGD